MPAPHAPIRVEGRRLRAIRVSPTTAAVALALLVVAFVAWIASMLTTIAVLSAVAGVAGAGAVVMAARYTWRRLTRRGRLLFGLPAALFPVAFILAALGLPGATVVGYAAAVVMIGAIGFGVVARPSMSATLALARARVDSSLVRSEEATEALPVVLDERGMQFGVEGADGSEMWRHEEIASARVDEGGERTVLRVTDRVGDEIAVEVGEGYRAAAVEMVERVSWGRR